MLIVIHLKKYLKKEKCKICCRYIQKCLHTIHTYIKVVYFLKFNEDSYYYLVVVREKSKNWTLWTLFELVHGFAHIICMILANIAFTALMYILSTQKKIIHLQKVTNNFNLPSDIFNFKQGSKSLCSWENILKNVKVFIDKTIRPGL